MGCCVSTLDDNKQHSLKKDQHFSCVSKSPPILEEESVKEVLSETPKPKHKPGSETGTKLSNNVEQPTKSRPFLEQKIPSLMHKLPHYEQKLTSMEQKLIPMKQNKYYPDPTTTPEAEEEQISEVCSLSESISTTTLEDHHMQLPNYTTTTTAGDFPQRVMYRSQGQNSHFLPKNNYHNNHGRSPVRRADPSPPRKNSPGRVGTRRDAVGDNSARRSRSPSTRSNVGRSPSARRAGPSPGRVRMVNGPGEVRREREANVDEWAGPEESLENPLVSLECFIFL